MTIEITTIDIICRIIAGAIVILCVALHFYDRHKMIRWFKENSKDERGGNE